VLLVGGCGPGTPPRTEGGPPQLRRLTEEQYRGAIADIFGSDITVAGRFEPDRRKAGLLAVGAGMVTITPAGFEQYDGMARTIAAQVTDEAHRGRLIGCGPADPAAADEACARQVIARYGRLLFRRPLTQPEIDGRAAEATAAKGQLGSFRAGLQHALVRLLDSPDFLFRIDATEPDPARPGQARLTAYARAARLSYLLWNATPDEALLHAAAAGRLDSPEGLKAEVDRLMASPRLTDGVRAFFADFLQLAEIDNLQKDPLVYPAYNQKVLQAAREQTLRTVTGLLLDEKRDYRELFTSRRTVMTKVLGPVYWVPVDAREGWEPYEFAKGDPRSGIATQIAFTALHSHPGRGSATLRGKAIREILLCQPVAAPPANVNFSIVQDTSNAQFKTARDRLTAHRSDPSCAGCHKVIDPIGLALESFDGLGQLRSEENGVAIDASGDLDGRDFRDAAGLGEALARNPAATACLADSLYRYATGREWQKGEREWQDWLHAAFARDGYRLPDLLRRIALSEAFFQVAAPPPPPVKEARS
jgi:hypothetical protein